LGFSEKLVNKIINILIESISDIAYQSRKPLKKYDKNISANITELMALKTSKKIYPINRHLTLLIKG
jgi:hypothetical protein